MDIAENTINENQHMVIYYCFNDIDNVTEEIPDLKATTVCEFENWLSYVGQLDEITSLMTPKKIKPELDYLIDAYLKSELSQSNEDQNQEVLNFGYELSMLLLKWIEK